MVRRNDHDDDQNKDLWGFDSEDDDSERFNSSDKDPNNVENFDFWQGDSNGGFITESSSKPSKLGRVIEWFSLLSRKGKIIVAAGLGVVVTTTIILIGSSIGVKDLPYEQTSVYELSNVVADIQDSDVENLSSYIGTSWLAKEWDYFNQIESRENFYTSVMGTVDFNFPEYVEGESGLETLVPTDVTHIDWVKVTNDMRDFDFELIQSMYSERDIKKSNYEFHKELTNLFSDYISSLDELPVTNSNLLFELTYEVQEDKTYAWQLVTDQELDQLLFSSPEFHRTLDIFGGIATGDIGDLKVNPNWEEWQSTHDRLESQLDEEKNRLSDYNGVVTNDNGTVLYKNAEGEVVEVINLNGDMIVEDSELEDDSSGGRDLSGLNTNNDEDEEDETESRLHEDGDFILEAPVVENPSKTIVNAIVNQLEVMEANEPLHTYIDPKKKDRKEWKEWDELTDEEKEETDEPKRKEEVPLPSGELIPYKWVGSYFLQNEYSENDEPVVILPEIGDGSFERPLGYNTPIVAKMIGEDGSYHDVKVFLTLFKRGQDAIDYASEFDTRNRGFDLTSDRELVTVEYKVENLTDEEITLQSEFALSDSDSNLVARTGDMYSFKEKAKIKPNEVVAMQDWFYTKNPENTHLIWGKSFEREHPAQWYQQFKLGVENDLSLPPSLASIEDETDVEIPSDDEDQEESETEDE